jgi:polyisoprenoid-binding protein YceI
MVARVVKAALLISMLAAGNVLAGPLKVDPVKSGVGVTFKQMGVAVDAKFNKLTAQVEYDPAKPENAKANVEIDVSSFDLGDPDYSAEVRKKEWFHAVQFPKATFSSSKIRAAGAGKLDVTGKLTLKGKVTDLQFPLSVKKEGSAHIFEGSVPIKRLAFGIGDGEWKDTSVVADEVIIKFRIVAQ